MGGTTETFDSGSARVVEAPWNWLHIRSRRFPVLIRNGAAGGIHTTPEEYYGVVSVEERRRTLATILAGHVVIAAGYGTLLPYVALEQPGAVPEDDEGRPIFSYAMPPGPGLPAPTGTAIHLAGQLALEIDLTRRWLRDPRRVLTSWMITGPSIDALGREDDNEHFAYLFGPRTEAPAHWTARAVHIDHLRDQVRAWLEGHWESVEAITRHLISNGHADADAIAALLLSPTSRAPLDPMPDDHPLKDTTNIPTGAIAAAAAWWTETLRETLRDPDPLGTAAGDTAYRSPRRLDAAIGHEKYEAFRRALALEVRGRIERRTPRMDGGLDRRPNSTGEFDYILEMSGYDTPPPVAAALKAAGIYPAIFTGLTDIGVELSTSHAVARTRQGPVNLWSCAEAAGDRKTL